MGVGKPPPRAGRRTARDAGRSAVGQASTTSARQRPDLEHRSRGDDAAIGHPASRGRAWPRRGKPGPLASVGLERLIASLGGRDRAIVLLGGHLGLRPLEIRQVPWSAFDGSTLTIGRARTKRSAARTRLVTVPAITARELRAWQMESAGRGGEPIIGPLGSDGLRLWAYKRLDPAAHRATGRDDVTLYTLRHTHASALHYCNDYTLPRILKRLGHSAPVHFQHYAHIVDAAEGRPHHASLDALIEQARAQLVFRQSSAGES